MSDDSRERTLTIIGDHHDQIATFARQSYALDGRGVTRISFPDVPPGTTAIVATEMVYHTLAEIRRVTANLTGTTADDAAVLIRMIDTYDPARQAVVTAAIAGQNPITIKMKLERPFLLDDADGVH